MSCFSCKGQQTWRPIIKLTQDENNLLPLQQNLLALFGAIKVKLKWKECTIDTLAFYHIHS